MLDKKWKKVLFVLGGIFILYSAIWSAYVTYRYEPFRKKLGTTVGVSKSYLQKDRYTYSVFKPHFLSFTGNLHISEYITVGDDHDETVSADLIIWPRGINDYEIGVGIITTTTYNNGHSTYSICTNMMLDKDMNLLDDTPENRALYEQNLDKIENLYHLAYDMWGILELP